MNICNALVLNLLALAQPPLGSISCCSALMQRHGARPEHIFVQQNNGWVCFEVSLKM